MVRLLESQTTVSQLQLQLLDGFIEDGRQIDKTSDQEGWHDLVASLEGCHGHSNVDEGAFIVNVIVNVSA